MKNKHMIELNLSDALCREDQTFAYLRVYTKDWKNTESDSIHFEYSYNKNNWYALNGNNAIVFPTQGSRRLTNPRIHQSNNFYCITAVDAVHPEFIFVYKSDDLIHFASEEYTKKDTFSFSDKNTEQIIEIPLSILHALQDKWGKPEPVLLKAIESPQISCEMGSFPNLPETVLVEYSNNMTMQRQVEWDVPSTQSFTSPGQLNIDGVVKEPVYNSPLISHRADPFIYKHSDGTYYFTGSYTDMEHNLIGKYQYLYIILRKANTIEDLADGTGNYEEKIVYQRKPICGGTKSPHIWAPEIHMIQGKWYIYYTTTISDESPWRIRPHCLECSGNDPFQDKWIEKGPMKTTVEGDIAFTDFSLDHTHFNHNGADYLLWAQKTNNISDIFIAKLSNPWTICTPSVLVTHPDYNWETHGFAVNEGAAVIKHGGNIFVTFSASGTDAMYCMGYVYADENADLLDAKSWIKCPYPVFQSNPDKRQYGPGHNSFTRSNDDQEDLFIYHGRQEERYLIDENYQPLYDAGRNAFVGKVFWNEDGMPNFSVPGAEIIPGKATIKTTVLVTVVS